MAIQPDGKLLAAGGWDRTVAVDKNHHESIGGGLALVRFGRNGAWDASFGPRGMVISSHTMYAGDLVIQPDGKIVVTDGLGLARYRTDGHLDRTFGTNGRVRTPTRFESTEAPAPALALQGDGKIVVAGAVGQFPHSDFAIARYLDDGALDPSFGNEGRVRTDFGGSEDVEGVVVQSDGKIVVAGDKWPRAAPTEFAVARYWPDGPLDESFGNGGKVTTSFGEGQTEAFGLAIWPQSGKLVVAGDMTRNGDSVYEFAVAQYLADGRLDMSFGRQGKVAAHLSGWDTAYAVATQPDGKIIAGGTWQWTQSCGKDCERSTDSFALVRYLSDGSLDRTFGQPARR